MHLATGKLRLSALSSGSPPTCVLLKGESWHFCSCSSVYALLSGSHRGHYHHWHEVSPGMRLPIACRDLTWGWTRRDFVSMDACLRLRSRSSMTIKKLCSCLARVLRVLGKCKYMPTDHALTRQSVVVKHFCRTQFKVSLATPHIASPGTAAVKLGQWKMAAVQGDHQGQSCGDGSGFTPPRE